MGNTASSSSGSKSRRSRHSSETATDRARKVVGDLQATFQSTVKKLDEQDHPAAHLIDTVCGQYFDDHDSKLNRHSRSASFYSEDISEDDSRTISEDETTLDTDCRPSSGKGNSKKDNQSVESSSYQSDYASEMSRDVQKNSSSKKKSKSRGVDDTSFESEEESSYTPKGVVTETNLDVGPGQLSKPLASAFAKRCYFTKSGIGKTTQHYEGLTLTGNVVLMLAAAMKLKGCPTICDEDLRRVEQTYPNQFSRLPDELLLSSGWRRISKYCHFSNKPIPDGIPFFHSKQRLHPNGGYYFLLAAAVGMVRPLDVEPLNRDTLVLLETDFPTQCDAAPEVLIKEPEQWTLVDKFCFFSGGPINTDEDVYYQADFDGNPIFMLAFLSPSLTPEELYKLDNSDKQGEPGLKSVAAVEEVESVYDLTERDFHDLKLYHLGPCRALPQYILQPQAWTKVLPPHFLAARQRAILRAHEYEARHGVPQMPPPNTAENPVDPSHQLTVGATPLNAHMPSDMQEMPNLGHEPEQHYPDTPVGQESDQHYPDSQNYYMPPADHEQIYDQSHQGMYAQQPYQQAVYEQGHEHVYDQIHQQPMYDQSQIQQPLYENYNTSEPSYPTEGISYPAPTPEPYLSPQGLDSNPYHVQNEDNHMQQQHLQHQPPPQLQEDRSDVVPNNFQHEMHEEGAFVDENAPIDEAAASHVPRTNTSTSAQLGVMNTPSGVIENHSSCMMETHRNGTMDSRNSGMFDRRNNDMVLSNNGGSVESRNSGVVESHHSDTVENQSHIELEDSKSSFIGQDTGFVESHNSNVVESRNSGGVESHNSGLSLGLVESHNSVGLNHVEGHNSGLMKSQSDNVGSLHVDNLENQSAQLEVTSPTKSHSTTRSEEGIISVNDNEQNFYDHTEDDLEAQVSESQDAQNSPYTDGGYSLSPDREQEHEFFPREEQYFDSPEQQDGQHEFFGTPSVEQPDDNALSPETFSPDVDEFVEDEFGRTGNDYDDNDYGENDFGRNPYKENEYDADNFDGEDYEENDFDRHDYNGEEYYKSPQKTISDTDSADYSREMEREEPSPIRTDHLRRLGRQNGTSPSVNNQAISPSSEYSHTSAMRGAQELLRRNRLKRQERARRQSNEPEPSPVMDEYADPALGPPTPSPHSRTDEESSTWESGSELTSVISGSSVWTDSSNNADRSSRRALILQMAKARMRSNKEREDKMNTTIAEEFSEGEENNRHRNLAEAGGADIDFSADLD